MKTYGEIKDGDKTLYYIYTNKPDKQKHLIGVVWIDDKKFFNLDKDKYVFISNVFDSEDLIVSDKLSLQIQAILQKRIESLIVTCLGDFKDLLTI